MHCKLEVVPSQEMELEELEHEDEAQTMKIFKSRINDVAKAFIFTLTFFTISQI